MATTITNIPKIMRSNSWLNGARLMEIWFSRAAAIAPGYGPPDTTTIKMDSWVLTFSAAKDVYDKMIKEKIWQNQAAQTEIVKMLRRKGLLLANQCFYLPFGNLSLPVEIQDADYINQRIVKMTSTLDDLSAALANFVFNVVVSGHVSNEKSGYKAEISKVGIYVKDSYDFNGQQFLGYWNDTNNCVSMINPFCGTSISNQDFSDWRAKNGKGGDFRVFSDVKQIFLSPPFTFLIP